MIVGRTNVNKYLNHGLSSSLVKFYMAEDSRVTLSLPVCPRCERVGLRDRGWALNKIMCCPHCGYKGPATHQLLAYLKESAYK